MKRKNCLSFLLALTVALTMGMPGQVYAQEYTDQGQTVTAGEAGEEETQVQPVTAGETVEDIYADADRDSAVLASAVSCTSQSELETALANASTDEENPTVITIGGDFEISGQIVVEEGTYVTMQSASSGQVRTLKENTKFANTDLAGLLYVKGSLTLRNLVLDGDYLGRVAIVENGASLTLDTGATIQNGIELGPKSAWGLGVYVRDGSEDSHGIFEMKDGAKITGCHATGLAAQKELGIGVYLGKYGQFTMTGGEITGNEDIGNGHASSPYAMGGGVYVQNFCRFTMSGGKITENSARYGGGGIYVCGTGLSSEVTLSGDALIGANESASGALVSEFTSIAGGGVYVEAGILRLTENASIQNNTVCGTTLDNMTGCGGGVYLYGGEFYMDGGSITGNTAQLSYSGETGELTDVYAEGDGGGIYIRGGKFVMTDGSITGNKAKTSRAGNDVSEIISSGNGGGLCIGFTADTNHSEASEVYIKGGQITDNQADGKGSGIYLMNQLTLVTNSRMYDEVSAVSYSAQTSLLDISGAPVIDEIYLPDDFTGTYGTTGVSQITLSGRLSADAAIGVALENAKAGRILAVPAEEYSIRNSDLARISFLNQEESSESGTTGESGTAALAPELSDDGQIVLAAADTSEKTDLSSAEVTVASVTYDGTEKRPVPSVTFEGKELTKGTDYTVSYQHNKNAGTAELIINGKGSYTGTIEKTFEIRQLAIDDASITAEPIPDKYTCGVQLTPPLTLTFGDSTLTEKSSTDTASDETTSYDYEISYGENLTAGTGTIQVTGHGNFTGTRTITFIIKDGESNGSLIVHNEQELHEALSKELGTEEEAYRIILACDIDMDEICATGENLHSVISGNGYTVRMNESNPAEDTNPEKAMIEVLGKSSLIAEDVTFDGNLNARIFYVAEGAELTVSDTAVLMHGKSSKDTKSNKAVLGGQCIYNAGTLCFSGTMENAKQGYYGSLYNAGSCTLEDGCLLQELKTTNGGAVYNAETGICTMEGGVIRDINGMSTLGAAITNKGTFLLNDGVITGTDCSLSAVYNAGTFIMNGGSIVKNVNKDTGNLGMSGGAISQRSGTYTMNGGKISENQSAEGGGVMVLGGTFEMTGEEAQITDNTALYEIISSTNVTKYGNGGGVFVNKGTFQMSAGRISENEASYTMVSGKQASFNGYGGGIFLNGGSLKISGGTISDNKAKYENMEGIYYGKQNVGSTADSNVSFSLSGSPSITDTIYMEKDRTIQIDGTLGETSFRVKQEIMDYGTLLASYTDLSYGKTEDGGKFVAADSVKTYEYDTDESGNAQIAVAKLNLDDCTVELAQTEYAYTGHPILPDVIVTGPDGKTITNYKRTATANTDCGTATVTVSGDGYVTTGEKKFTFDIVPKKLEDKNVTVTNPKQIYTGSALEPEYTVTCNGLTLTEGTDYTAEYLDNINGNNGDHTGKIQITGTGNFTGTATGIFTIKKEAKVYVNKLTVTCGQLTKLLPYMIRGNQDDSEDFYTFSGADKRYAKVDSKGNVTGVSVGTTKVTITTKETDAYYSASVKATIKIVRGTQKITGVGTTLVKTYRTSAFALGAKTTGNGKLTFKSSNTKIASVTSSGKVKLKGYGKVTITVTASKTTNYAKATKKITLYVNPKTPKVSSVKNSAAKSVLVKWRADSRASGYQVRYATDKYMTSPVLRTVSGSSSKSCTLTGLKKGKTYYVQIRTYKMIGTSALASSWTTVKKVKVTK